jgi:hypothetical protein
MGVRLLRTIITSSVSGRMKTPKEKSRGKLMSLGVACEGVMCGGKERAQNKISVKKDEDTGSD